MIMCFLKVICSKKLINYILNQNDLNSNDLDLAIDHILDSNIVIEAIETYSNEQEDKAMEILEKLYEMIEAGLT